MADGAADAGPAGAGEAAEPPAAIQWAEVTDPGWRPSFTSTETGLSRAFAGSCPRCLHPTMFAVPFTRPESAGQTFRGTPETFTMFCECGYPHPGHPSDDNSCGAYWPYDADL